ncbi:MAG: hypothetical protein WA001_04755 [Patescibacteria group bacterium]
MNKSLALQVSNVSWTEAEFNAACEKLASQRATPIEAAPAQSERRLVRIQLKSVAA